MEELQKEIEKLKTDNENLRFILNQGESKVCSVGIDYQSEYNRQAKQINDLTKENEGLKKAIIKLAMID